MLAKHHRVPKFVGRIAQLVNLVGAKGICVHDSPPRAGRDVPVGRVFLILREVVVLEATVVTGATMGGMSCAVHSPHEYVRIWVIVSVPREYVLAQVVW